MTQPACCAFPASFGCWSATADQHPKLAGKAQHAGWVIEPAVGHREVPIALGQRRLGNLPDTRLELARTQGLRLSIEGVLRALHIQLLLMQLIERLLLTQQRLIALHSQRLQLLLQRGELVAATAHHRCHTIERSAKWRIILQGALHGRCLLPGTQVGQLPTQLLSEFTFTATEKHNDYPVSPYGRCCC